MNPRAFTISCSIGTLNFSQALYDLGANINLMQLVVYNSLGLWIPTTMSMRILIVDETIKKSIGILCYVLVKVSSFIFLTNFVILKCKEDFYVPIILRRPFIVTGKALVNIEI